MLSRKLANTSAPPLIEQLGGSSAALRTYPVFRNAAEMPVIERSAPAELRPLRDALSQLQMAYAPEPPFDSGMT